MRHFQKLLPTYFVVFFSTASELPWVDETGTERINPYQQF